MKRALCLFAVWTNVAIAQSRGQIPTSRVSDLPIDLKNSKLQGLMIKPPHIHYTHQDCRNAPDKVFSKTNGIYYACMDHQEVCNKPPHSIPKQMIDTFEREIREFKEGVERSQRESKERIDAARAKDEAEWGPRRAAAARMRESRMSGAERYVPSTRGSAVPIEPAMTPASQQAKVADERVAEISEGTAREELMRKFGQPHSRISGDTECLTYLLSSGASVKFDLEGGVVKSIRRSQP